MARNIVHRPVPRCPGCRMPPRWCLCEAYAPIACPVQVDVLIDHIEHRKPTSTGLLIHRLMPGVRLFPYRRSAPTPRSAVCIPGREVWILHPRGEILPRDVPLDTVQVLLLDASWRESAAMLRDVKPWGRTVQLPMTGPNRYWLRAQSADDRFSTLEALAFLLDALDHRATADALRLQFELHVYAGLLSRGNVTAAADYLRDSPIRTAFPDLITRIGPAPRSLL